MAFVAQTFDLRFASSATNASVSTAMNMPGSYLYVYLQVPTMSVGYSAASTPIYIQASTDGSNWFRFTNTEPTNNTLVAGINDFQIASSVSSRMVMIPNFGLNWIRLEVSGTVTNPTAQTYATNAGFRVVAISNQ